MHSVRISPSTAEAERVQIAFDEELVVTGPVEDLKSSERHSYDAIDQRRSRGLESTF